MKKSIAILLFTAMLCGCSTNTGLPATPAATAKYTSTVAYTSTPCITPPVTPVITQYATPTSVPDITATATPTSVPTKAPTQAVCPTATPTPLPTATPMPSPTATPTPSPTATPACTPGVDITVPDLPCAFDINGEQTPVTYSGALYCGGNTVIFKDTLTVTVNCKYSFNFYRIDYTSSCDTACAVNTVQGTNECILSKDGNSLQSYTLNFTQGTQADIQTLVFTCNGLCRLSVNSIALSTKEIPAQTLYLSNGGCKIGVSLQNGCIKSIKRTDYTLCLYNGSPEYIGIKQYGGNIKTQNVNIVQSIGISGAVADYSYTQNSITVTVLCQGSYIQQTYAVENGIIYIAYNVSGNGAGVGNFTVSLAYPFAKTYINGSKADGTTLTAKNNVLFFADETSGYGIGIYAPLADSIARSDTRFTVHGGASGTVAVAMGEQTQVLSVLTPQ